jgi:alpha-D-ribose 1-methylphosphonate 5-triphosphate synthase subunit PhnG
MGAPDDGGEGRAAAMGVLARAEPAALAAAMASLGPLPDLEHLRPPQIGLVMARGRAGATGAAFNLGEVSATRCAVRLATGETGFACVLGRDKAHAERAAVCDALLRGGRAAEVRDAVIGPLERAEAARRETRARKAAATKVEFFTLAREQT